MTSATLTTRNATLGDLAEILKDQHARKLDVVAPATSIEADNGRIKVAGTEPILGPDGVTRADGIYRPTTVAVEGLASKLGVPVGYLKGLHADRPDLFDANVNGWLHGGTWNDGGAGADDRKFLVRAFRSDGEDGVARAFLSDAYKPIDNLDVLTAALDGVKRSGMDIEIVGCDLTERNMHVRIASREVAALAPTLLDGYRSPFSGQRGEDLPRVFAGFVIRNSEVGTGAFTITPRIVFEVCSNGVTMSKDALRHVHLGSRLDEGVIKWSDDTQRQNVELVASQARDAVATFLDVEYVESILTRISEKADAEVTDPADAVEEIGKSLRYTEDEREGILNAFIDGGQRTAGGLMQAVTAHAQRVDDADRAADMEDDALRVLDLAAAR